MAHINDFNQTEAGPKVCVGNWVEERALLAATGVHRKRDDGQDDTAPRVTGGDETNDWQTSTNSTHSYRVFLPNRSGQSNAAGSAWTRRKEEQYLARAKEIREQERAAVTQEAEKLDFGGRPPLNRKRALEPLDRDRETYDLFSPAITLYSENPEEVPTGHTPSTAWISPFAKSTAFSKPAAEFMAAPMR
jgi:hypothetical protein